MATSTFRVLLLGATGETSKEVLKQLKSSDKVSNIILVGRRKVEGCDDDQRIDQRIIDFDKLEEFPEAFKEADIAYCCLGTTRGKAGKEGFKKVDFDYIVNSAKCLKEAGCRDYHLVSSKGASAGSFFLYPQIKGKAEEEIKGLGFERVSIYRPGLLMCERQENRTGEKIIRGLAGWIDGGGRMSIQTETLAKAMISNSFKPMAQTDSKNETIEHGDIFKLI